MNEVGAPTGGTSGEPETVKSISPNVSNFKLELGKEVYPDDWFPPIRNENALVNRRMNYLTNNE